MSDKAGQVLELRAIEVSTRAALRHAICPADEEHIRARAAHLLDRLKARVMRDGGDPKWVSAVERVRQQLLGASVGVS